MQKRKIKFFTQSRKGREEEEKKIENYARVTCLSFRLVWLPVLPSIRPSVRPSVSLSVCHILGVIIVSLSGISGLPQRQGTTSTQASLAALPSTHFLTFSTSHSYSLTLSLSHSSRFSYNNILIPLIHATLAAKPNKLKAAVRARRLRGLLNVACCRCRCCWTLPAFRRTHFLGFSHLHLPGRFGRAREQGLVWVLLVCVNH